MSEISNQFDDIDIIKSQIKMAIKRKGVDVSDSDTFYEYPNKIEAIPTGGPDPVLEDKTLVVDASTPVVSTILPDSGYDGLSSLELDLTYIDDRLDTVLGSGTVPVPEPFLEDVTIVANGTYSAGTGYDGLGTVEVDVPIPAPLLEDKTVVANGTVTAGTGYDGLGTVVVDVPTGSGIGITREVSDQGVYQMPSSNFTFSLPSNVIEIGPRALESAFTDCTNLVNVSLPSLTTLNSEHSMLYAFQGCTNLLSVDLSGLTTVYNNSMRYTFSRCTSLSSVDLSRLTTIGQASLSFTFSGCTGLTSISLPSLTTITGSSGMSNCFESCIHLASVNFPNLTQLGSNAFDNTFIGCSSLTSIDLSSLTTFTGGYEMRGTFERCTSLSNVNLSGLSTMPFGYCMINTFKGCTSLTSLSFPSLNSSSFGSYTTQFYNMLIGVTGCTVHFPSNLQSVIGGWSDVTAGFGGTNTTVLFDLPATT